jgi:hypothetical protein
VSPSHGATAVRSNAKVVALFDQVMDAVSVAAAFPLVHSSNHRNVAGRVIPFDRVLVFVPSRPPAPGVRYTATISTAATDKVGIHLRHAKQWSFTIARR